MSFSENSLDQISFGTTVATNESHKFAVILLPSPDLSWNHSDSSLNGIDFACALVPFPAQISLFASSNLFTAMGRGLSFGLPSVFFVIPARHDARKSNFDWHAWDICGKQSRKRRAHTSVAAAADRRILKGFDVSELDASLDECRWYRRRLINTPSLSRTLMLKWSPYPFTFHTVTWIYWTFSKPINVVKGLANYLECFFIFLIYIILYVKIRGCQHFISNWKSFS